MPLSANDQATLNSLGLSAAYDTLVEAGYESYIAQLEGADGYGIEDAVVQAQFKQATDQIHDLAMTIAQAQAAGQLDAIPGLKQQISYWLAQQGAAKNTAQAIDTPSGVLLSLDKFSDDAINVAKSAGVGAESLLNVASGLLKNLPLVLGVVVLLVVGYLVLRRRGIL